MLLENADMLKIDMTNSSDWLVQKLLFEKHFKDSLIATCDIVTKMIYMPEQYAATKRVAENRFAKGFAEFGDAMFAKSKDELAQDIIEELVDAVIYGIAIKAIHFDGARNGGAAATDEG